MGLRDLSAILWGERHLLELLLFKLDEEQLVLAAGVPAGCPEPPAKWRCSRYHQLGATARALQPNLMDFLR